MSFLYRRIDARVQKRLNMGFLDEVKNLLKKYNWSHPGLQIAAYHCLKPYFDYQKSNNNLSKKKILSDCLKQWSYAEHSDARRQSCWFRSRAKDAAFFDITQPNFEKKINKLVSQWYTRS
jgi:tRNA A37 N6-isopentenylltransferase MiaA